MDDCIRCPLMDKDGKQILNPNIELRKETLSMFSESSVTNFQGNRQDGCCPYCGSEVGYSAKERCGYCIDKVTDIYVGDILQVGKGKDEKLMEVKFEDGWMGGTVKTSTYHMRHTSLRSFIVNGAHWRAKIIGNKWQNPDLLEIIEAEDKE